MCVCVCVSVYPNIQNFVQLENLTYGVTIFLCFVVLLMEDFHQLKCYDSSYKKYIFFFAVAFYAVILMF